MVRASAAILARCLPVDEFSDCLFGSELFATPIEREEPFLSCLFGSELTGNQGTIGSQFLSCLFGSGRGRSRRLGDG